MSLESLQHLEHEFQSYLAVIHQNINPHMHKSERIRLNSWIKKLCSVIDNVFWRKNRNFYAEVLACMLINKEVGFPFNKPPPEESLPKLTPYQVPFSIRQQLSKQKQHHQSNKENISEISNVYPEYQSRKQISKKKEKKEIGTERAPSTRRKGSFKKEDKSRLLLSSVKDSLSFLLQNYKIFENSAEYKDIIFQMIGFGDQMGENLRNMQINITNN